MPPTKGKVVMKPDGIHLERVLRGWHAIVSSPLKTKLLDSSTLQVTSSRLAIDHPLS